MMATKYLKKSSRSSLKRVRTDSENDRAEIMSGSRANKKLSRQPLEEVELVEKEKSSDERAFELFHREYFGQFRPFLKHRPMVEQLLEHLWSNMTESSKVAFVKKILKQQAGSASSTAIFTSPNDENDSRSSRSFNRTTSNKYTRGFVNDLLSHFKHWITPRYIDTSVSTTTSLRRSSRIRRVPVKCTCSDCATTHSPDKHASPESMITDDPQEKLIRQLAEQYLELDDQFTSALSAPSLPDPKQASRHHETNIIRLPKPLAETNVSTTVLPPFASIMMRDTGDISLPSMTDSSTIFNEDIPVIASEPLPRHPTSRTYIILTELDEPFFGPYPIEFTITI